jgi:hypothetical protein
MAERAGAPVDSPVTPGSFSSLITLTAITHAPGVRRGRAVAVCAPLLPPARAALDPQPHPHHSSGAGVAVGVARGGGWVMMMMMMMMWWWPRGRGRGRGPGGVGWRGGS